LVGGSPPFLRSGDWKLDPLSEYVSGKLAKKHVLKMTLM